MADYILLDGGKKANKKVNILSDNRMKTIERREVSFQALVEEFREDEDAIYNLITNDKNIIFMPKVSITDADLAAIPSLRNIREAITKIEQQAAAAQGQNKFLLKKQVIELRKDQYLIKNIYNKPLHFSNGIKSFSTLSFDEKVKVYNREEIAGSGLINFFNPAHVSILLRNYSKLKEESYGKFWSDAYFLIISFEQLVDRALAGFPLYLDLIKLKVDGLSGREIIAELAKSYNKTYTPEYISSLWRKKIPKIISKRAEEEYLIWYYTEKKRGKWKKCSRCGQIKLMSSRFFSRNSASKDGYYSICKECRNKKSKGVK